MHSTTFYLYNYQQLPFLSMHKVAPVMFKCTTDIMESSTVFSKVKKTLVSLEVVCKIRCMYNLTKHGEGNYL